MCSSVDDDMGIGDGCSTITLLQCSTISLFHCCTVTLLQASPEDSTCSASQTCVGCRCLEQVFFKDMISAQMLCRGKIFVEKISVMSKVWKIISKNLPRDAIATQLPRTQTGLELN